jgi:hypothetical protein
MVHHQKVLLKLMLFDWYWKALLKLMLQTPESPRNRYQELELIENIHVLKFCII